MAGPTANAGGGIFSKVNSALPTGQRNNLPPGLHRLRIEEVKFVVGTAKNAGKEFFIINGKIVATSVKDNPNIQVGSTVSIAFNTMAYPESAASDIKSFLTSQFTEQELAQAPRSILLPEEVQHEGNPYIQSQFGLTWTEVLRCVAHRKDSIFKDRLVDVESINKPTKAGTDYTKHYYKRAGEITSLGPIEAAA